MSAFGFINNSKQKGKAASPLLSPSLVEDLYDSQHLNSFINSSRTFSSTPSLQQRVRNESSLLLPMSSPGKSKKPSLQKSYFSIIDDLDSFSTSPPRKGSSNNSIISDPIKETTLLQVEPLNSSSQLGKSAFGFIDQPKAPPKRSLPANSEMKLISATASLHRLEAEKVKQTNKVQRLYTKKRQIVDQLSTLKSKIDLVRKQKDQALEKEDFLLAETLQTQEEKMMHSLFELQEAPQLLGKQIFTSWQRVHALQKQEAQLAEEVAACCKKVREERFTQHMKFISDSEKLHEQKLQELDKQGEIIESERSERAFDLGLWEQAEEDLVAKEDDAIHEELKQKKDIEAQTQLIQNEIKELKDRLKSLETQKSELLANAVEIDLSIQEKLKPFMNERLEHEQEFETIEIRKRDIEEKASQLQALETQIDLERSRHYEEKERGLEEIHALDEQIALATEKISCHEESMLNEILKQIEARDELVTRHQSEMQKHRLAMAEKKKAVEVLQYAVYDQQQMSIHQDETVLEMQQKLKTLARHKQIAIEARRYQNAAAWTNQINLLQAELSKLDGQKQIDTKLEEQLENEQKELQLLEQRQHELDKDKNAEIGPILEKFRDDLRQITTNDPVIQTIIELELQMNDENDY